MDNDRMVESQRLLSAFEKARLELLGERERAGHWVGELATSALSTATAVSALAIVERHLPLDAQGRFADEARQRQLSQQVVRGLRWLCHHQNIDGGWGDTDKSYSNIATTMLVVAAFHLTGVPCDHAEMLAKAEAYIEAQGGVAGLKKRYGRDKTFAVPILTNCALAGIVPWKEVSPLPFELACLPRKWFHIARIPVVSYAIPALVAIGQARYFHKPPINPLTKLIRKKCVAKSLKLIEAMQPDSGGYLEAIPLTSFVVMSLASTGRADHIVARRGVDFLLSCVREDGSWPIDVNLATWNTTLAMNALASAGEDLAGESLGQQKCLDWLLSCQCKTVHPFTAAEPGGWGWSDLSGSVPDSDDTPGALLTLAAWHGSPSCSPTDRTRIEKAAADGLGWLLKLQNKDGGWPTFCRGWGLLPFDRSGADLTAHAIRAMTVWRSEAPIELRAGMDAAVAKGLQFLAKRQRESGSFVPLWFGNQDHPKEENEIYGTAKVLAAYRDLGQFDAPVARQALTWLAAQQNPDGSWGTSPTPDNLPRKPLTGSSLTRSGQKNLRESELQRGYDAARGSVEETALAVEILTADTTCEQSARAVERGLLWLCQAVEAGHHTECSPIGFYFAKLWYYERLYPLTFTTAALGQALARGAYRVQRKPAVQA